MYIGVNQTTSPNPGLDRKAGQDAWGGGMGNMKRSGWGYGWDHPLLFTFPNLMTSSCPAFCHAHFVYFSLLLLAVLHLKATLIALYAAIFTTDEGSLHGLGLKHLVDSYIHSALAIMQIVQFPEHKCILFLSCPKNNG